VARRLASWWAPPLAALVAGGTVVALSAALRATEPAASAGAQRPGPPATAGTAASTLPATTTTTRPTLRQPPVVEMPPLPPGGLGPGASGELVRAYQQRLADLRFDPGPIDGRYGGAMVYAVQAVQKIAGLARTGRIGEPERFVIAAFRYPEPLAPDGEANRTEIDVGRQVLTLYEGHQVRLITTVSTGSGERYCFNTPRVNPTRRVCELANTPSGRFTYTRFVRGWDPSPLGRLYNPLYFNGGIAVHGYESVPAVPASHGCTRIPMHIAEWFPTVVRIGDPVYVFGGRPARILSSTPLAPAPAPTPAPPPAPAPEPPPGTAPPTTVPPTTPPTTAPPATSPTTTPPATSPATSAPQTGVAASRASGSRLRSA
jgi:peptidoglycan hydrolase-like protein with peptidoglycan-binding domain